MHYSKQFYAHPLYLKFQKVCRQLQQLMKKSEAIAGEKRQVLIKRRNYYLKKLTRLQQPAIAACSVIGLSVLLSASTKAQECRTFHLANESNPIKNNRLSNNLNAVFPYFVDIDGDGDLDCYESYFNAKHKLQLLLLRNNGTDKLPYFQKDTADGFETEKELENNYSVSKQQFADIDGDGDYDCFIGDYNYPKIIFYKNTGTKQIPHFEKQPQSANPLSFVHGYLSLYFKIVDLDADGDYDIVTSDLYSYLYGFHNYINVGTITNPVFEESLNFQIVDPDATFFDWNNDGLIDLYQRDFVNTPHFYRNMGPADNPTFVIDNNGPKFPRELYPYQIVDLNNDGYLEAFNSQDNYATLAPLATIDSSTVIISGVKVLKLKALPSNATLSYRWRRNGKDIFQNNRSFIIAERPGLYTVEITGNCGTGVSLPYQVTKSAQNGSSNKTNDLLAADNKQLSLTAYPNPFTQQFTLNPGNTYPANTVIKVTDVQGKVVLKMKATGSAMHLGKELQRGIYIVQVLQNNIVVQSQKVIKQ